MRTTIIRHIPGILLAPSRDCVRALRAFRAPLKMCVQGWQAHYRFAALILLAITPFRQLAKPRRERQPSADLYVMF